MSESTPKKILNVSKPSKTCQFIVKLIEIMKSYPQNVVWTEDGTHICFKDLDVIQKQVLPKFFRHRNMLSFIRQLNMYYFYKVQSSDERQMRFRNSIFCRGNEANFHTITRRNKNREEMVSTFEKNYAKTLELIDNQTSITPKTKSIVKLAMEYTIITYKNLKKIKSALEELLELNKAARGKELKNQFVKAKQQHLPVMTKLIEEAKFLDSYVKEHLWRDIRCLSTTQTIQPSYPSQAILFDEPGTIKDAEMNRVFNLQSDPSIMHFNSDCSLYKNLKEEDNNSDKEQISLQEDLKEENCKEI